MLSSVDRLLFVRRVPIFKELRDDFIVRLTSVMHELEFPANHTIFKQGEEGRSLYIVVSGKVEVHIGDQKLAEVEQGKYFGEMAVFDTQPRSASATTLEASEFLELTQEQLYDAIEETPEIAVNIIRELSRLVRRLNDHMNVTNSRNI
ncbi:cyclic nucleotide-binding domain-containing protein [Nodularia harveyana UHCC-0300]|uniref:Cyclic nucleotide-binding domain-containing protein n=1 Tax=Nodularia harveyana UHCC-0300 TaxID=2974287 RepID=A0ABU5UHT6_9CYAN|nr:cyclic nucleotide-binding domain-containing protein [Nodularia harveyana]MEA5583070.1 cyclic nucleotide-binding domain-containing protein [Nodularia harveyana UHCC-0300]